jgi:hypothetical protein
MTKCYSRGQFKQIHIPVEGGAEMKIAIPSVTVAMFLTAQLFSCGLAEAQWRTPPIKTVGNETVSCDLVNSSGADITVTDLVISVQTLEGDRSSEVVNVPGPYVIADGRGIRGSSPSNVLFSRTVYCEIDPNSVISTGDKKLLFTMTVDDASGKAVTIATPRPRKQPCRDRHRQRDRVENPFPLDPR